MKIEIVRRAFLAARNSNIDADQNASLKKFGDCTKVLILAKVEIRSKPRTKRNKPATRRNKPATSRNKSNDY